MVSNGTRSLARDRRQYDVTPISMLFGLFMNASIPEAFGAAGWLFAAAPVEPMTLLTGTVALAGTVAIWWVYFRRSEGVARRLAGEDADPARTGRYATYGLMLMVAGLIGIAVGDELVLAHPTEHTDLATNATLYGGPVLFFVAQGWYMRSVMGELPRSRHSASWR